MHISPFTPCLTFSACRLTHKHTHTHLGVTVTTLWSSSARAQQPAVAKFAPFTHTNRPCASIPSLPPFQPDQIDSCCSDDGKRLFS
ncbi:unnamed protein product [Protopolystoma xenopodis]|uniref:Uncharacterized protein n=1 Tax=Protopolystoma xenopodis TaxID=117903 RepID=A0A448XRP5_9PLAT|nr:unnamed protein product [Protopolystoma xenopodis]